METVIFFFRDSILLQHDVRLLHVFAMHIIFLSYSELVLHNWYHRCDCFPGQSTKVQYHIQVFLEIGSATPVYQNIFHSWSRHLILFFFHSSQACAIWWIVISSICSWSKSFSPDSHCLGCTSCSRPFDGREQEVQALRTSKRLLLKCPDKCLRFLSTYHIMLLTGCSITG